MSALLPRVHFPRPQDDLWGTEGGDGTLGQFVIGARTRLLEKLSPEDRAALELGLDPFATEGATSTRAGVEQALLAMWASVTDAPFRDWLSDEANILIVSRQPHSAEVPTTGTSFGVEQQGRAWVNRVLLTQRDLPIAARLVYRLAWDTLADMGDNVDSAHVNKNVAPVRILWAGLPEPTSVIWPVPYFPALLDMELWADRWNEIVASASGLFLEDGAMNRGLLDRLAFAYINLVQQVALKRTPPLGDLPSNQPTAADWQALLREGVVSSGITPRGARWSAYEQFRRRLGLFSCAPLGLTSGAARAIRDELPEGASEYMTARFSTIVLDALRARFPDYPPF